MRVGADRADLRAAVRAAVEAAAAEAEAEGGDLEEQGLGSGWRLAAPLADAEEGDAILVRFFASG